MGHLWRMFPMVGPAPTNLIRPTVPPRPVSISSRSIWRRISSRTEWQWYRSGPGDSHRESQVRPRENTWRCQDTRKRGDTQVFWSRHRFVAFGSATDVEIGKRSHRSRSSPGVRIQGFQWQAASQLSRTEGLSAPVLHDELIYDSEIRL